MTRYTILWLPVIDWDGPWDGQQAIAARLAADGHSVTFMETPGVRSVARRDWRRIVRRLRNRVQGGVRGFRSLAPNLWRLSPVLLPFPGHVGVDKVNYWLLMQSLRHLPACDPSAPLMVWTYLPTPLAVDVIQALEPDVLVYYCNNEIADNPAGVAPGTRESEMWLVRNADCIFATSRAMFAKRQPINPHTVYLPAGSDVEPFLESWTEPEDIAHLPHPRICFFGTLDVWLDQELVRRVAQTFAEAAIALIGPIHCSQERLRLPNIHLLGPRPHHELPAYLCHMDVHMIPYQVSDYTVNIHPKKTYEALATGKPLVTTDLPELHAYLGPVTVTTSAEAFVDGIRAGLEEQDPALSAARREIACNNTWEARYGVMKEHVPGLR